MEQLIYTGDDRLTGSTLGQSLQLVFEGMRVNRKGADFVMSDQDLIRMYPDAWIKPMVRRVMSDQIELSELGEGTATDYEKSVARTLLATTEEHEQFRDAMFEVQADKVTFGTKRSQFIRDRITSGILDIAHLAELVGADSPTVHSAPASHIFEGPDMDYLERVNNKDPRDRVITILRRMPLGVNR